MENVFKAFRIRSLQLLARISPGATSLRVMLHRWRGVTIGENVWIGYDALIETSHPELVTLKAGAVVGIRATILAHFREAQGVVVEENAVIGPCVTVLPGVTIEQGAVVAAGSVVTQSVPAMTLVQGNPAKAIAKISVCLKANTSVKEFSKGLTAIR
jgi:acetyltransferase-like isoleucine patch superfamily enzyme